MDRAAESSRKPTKLPIWGWVLLAVAIVVAFWGYGQAELLLEAVNLRYCG